MEITWQKKNYTARHLVSFVYSALIVFIILLIPIQHRINYDTIQEKFISVKLIKNVSPINIPDPIKPTPLTTSSSSVKTAVPSLPELDVVESNVSSDSYYAESNVSSTQNSQKNDSYYTEAYDSATQVSQENDYYSDRNENIPSKRAENEQRVVGIDSDAENVDINGYNYDLLLNYDEERAAFLKEINEGLLNSDKNKANIDIPDVYFGQLELLPLKRQNK